MCYGCNEQGHQYQDCPAVGKQKRNETTDKTPLSRCRNTSSGASQTAAMRDAFQSKQSMHDVDMTDVLNTLPLRQEDLTASANTADEDSKTDTKTTDTEEARPQLSIRQTWERENANDIIFDIENLEAHKTTTIAVATLRDKPTGDTGIRAEPPERENGKGKFLAYRRYRKAELSPNENESLAPPNNTSPKRVKKLRTERDANIQRERNRSKTCATKSIHDALSV